MRHRILILPGYGDSGPGHWQTLWEKSDPAYRRVVQEDWEKPVRADWVRTLDRYVRAADADVILVAHSLAALVIPHWLAAAAPGAIAKVRAAFLVAVPDPEGPAFPAAALGFGSIPMAPFPFPSLMAASSNDEYSTPDFSRRCAQAWGSRLAELGPKGHINSESGLGIWDEGLGLLKSLIAASDPS